VTKYTEYSTKKIQRKSRKTLHGGVVDLIKQRKLKLFGNICRMNDNRLMVEGYRPHGRPAKNGLFSDE